MIRKAIALISGGLDSLLAAKVILDQGVHVEGINFFTGFCVEGHTHAIRKKAKEKAKKNHALWVAEQLNIKLHIIDIVEEYKDVLLNPKYGYGANLNPCLDCKIFMVRKAKEWMEQHNFDFIITGEVMGQRPKSQQKHLMPIVATQSGAEDRLLRPLSAQNLPPTLPERERWIDREKLLNFSGRNRKPQMQLAERYQFDYAQPAGGCCFLTNEHYTSKLKDLWQHRGTRDYELDDVLLLKVGRHIRPNNEFKLIIGREEGENNYLEGYCHQFTSLRMLTHNGPLALIDGDASAKNIFLASQILGRFSQGREEQAISVQVTTPGEEPRTIHTHPLLASELQESWYV